MRKDTIRVVEFSVTNIGSAALHTVQVRLPAANTGFLSLASPAIIPVINPQQIVPVVLLLSPKNTTVIGIHRGAVAFVDASVSIITGLLQVGFEFTMQSNETGSLLVSVSDEFTYYGTDQPKVEGALVTVQGIDGQATGKRYDPSYGLQKKRTTSAGEVRKIKQLVHCN